jgi:uncharacterized protein YqfA (UPF0365 family)
MTFSSIGVSQIVWGIIILVLFGSGCVALVKWFRAWQLSAQAWMANYHAGIVELLLFQLRGADIVQLVNTGILAKREGIETTIAQLAHHQLACGNIRLVVNALLSAKRNQLQLTFERAATIDLMGDDPVRMVAEAVHEANQIRLPKAAPGAGIAKDPLAPIAPETRINTAAVLLQATPGVVGVMVGEISMQAVLRFPHGDLQVQVRSATVPRAGDRMAIAVVDGRTIVAELAADPARRDALPRAGSDRHAAAATE